MYVLVLSARYDEAKMAIADSGRFSLKLLLNGIFIAVVLIRNVNLLWHARLLVHLNVCVLRFFWLFAA